MPVIDPPTEPQIPMPSVTSPFAGKRLRMFDHLRLSAYWFGSNFVWGALLGPVMSEQMTKLAPQDSARALAQLYFFGAFPALFLPLIIGVLSDRCTSVYGRRKPYIFLGGLLAMVGLAGLFFASMANSFAGFLTCYFVLQIGSNIALSAFMGIIPDLVPADQHGIASGYMAFMSQFSTLGGVFLGGKLISNGNIPLTYGLLGGVFVVFFLVSLAGIPENKLTGPVPAINWRNHFGSLIHPLIEYPDFRWVWITRGLMMLGFYSMSPYILYYLRDVIHVKNPADTAGMVLGIILLGATVSGVVGGTLSDRTGRKPIVYGSSIIIGVTSLAFIFCKNLEQATVVGIFFGLGYGAYISVDWALGTDVLPIQQDAGKDMGIWHVAMILPQQIGALLAGEVLQLFAIPGTHTKDSPGLYAWGGYAVIFSFSAVCFLVGGYLLRFIKGTR